jgi:hypothetical protein
MLTYLCTTNEVFHVEHFIFGLEQNTSNHLQSVDKCST